VAVTERVPQPPEVPGDPIARSPEALRTGVEETEEELQPLHPDAEERVPPE
jgi:hypothetical protein